MMNFKIQLINVLEKLLEEAFLLIYYSFYQLDWLDIFLLLNKLVKLWLKENLFLEKP